MKRKILSLILVFAMTVSLFTVGASAAEPTYGDTNGHWAESSIERWSGHGIIQGSNGLFDPNGQLTCAQLATILAKLLKLPAAKDAGFSDNKADAWYYDAINRCAAAGILNGNGDSTVTPEAPITRERAIVMLGRALGIEPIRKPDLTKYTDAAKVAPYAQGMVAAMIEAGIVGGVTADVLAPQDNINRASTVTILDRAISTYADKAGATIKADGKGIVLVVADDVTVTGDVDKLLVPADNVDVTVSGSKNIDDITVTGDNSKVILNNSTANDVTLDGKNTELETKSGSKVENVSVTEDAKGATVNAGSGTTVKNVENNAADTTITGSGSVKNVASDTDVTVETKGTEVKNTGNDKITVTDAKGKDSTVSATGSGSSTTVNKETTSSGGGYSHSHSYVYSTNWDTLASTKSCSCGASEAVENIYYIANDTQLAAFRDKVNAGNTFAGKTIKLTADIDLNNAAWTPIGTAEHPFSGTIKGNNKTISGLNNCLIKYATGNINIDDLNIEINFNDNKADFVGGLIGVYDTKNSTNITAEVLIKNVDVTGSIVANDKAGGIIGSTYNSSVGNGNDIDFKLIDCTNSATVTAKRAGGLIGTSCAYLRGDSGNIDFKLTIDGCENTAAVSSSKNSDNYRAGGFIGYCGGYGNYVFNNIKNTGTDCLIGISRIGSTPRTVTNRDGLIKDEYASVLATDDYDYYYGSVAEDITVRLWKWHNSLEQTQGSKDSSYKYVNPESMLRDDEWRFTIDGKHYKFASGAVHIRRVEDGVEQTSHVAININPNTYVIDGISVEHVENKSMNISGTVKNWTGWMAKIGAGTYSFDPKDYIPHNERANYTITESENGTWTVAEMTA